MSLFEELQLDEVDENDSGSFEPLPPGCYDFIVESIEQGESKKGSGGYYKAVFTIPETAEKYAGRKIFQYFNVFNVNATARKIARAQFKGFMLATGSTQADNLDDFLGAFFSAQVKVVPAKGEYQASNAIAKFIAPEKLNGNATQSLDDLPAW